MAKFRLQVAHQLRNTETLTTDVWLHGDQENDTSATRGERLSATARRTRCSATLEMIRSTKRPRR